MPEPQLQSIGDWAVLCLIAEGRTHGFAIARAFESDAPIGQIWRIPRPLVYRAISLLEKLGLVTEVGSAPGAGGPRRHLIEVTPEGADAVRRWLDSPVVHVRNARSELMFKLLFLERSGRDRLPLLTAELEVVQSIMQRRRDEIASGESFDVTLARWRLYSTEAVERFVRELIEEDVRRGNPLATHSPSSTVAQ